LENISKDILNCSKIGKTTLKYLVGGFAYDERMHEIFTGNNEGIYCVWSNKFYNDVEDELLSEDEFDEEFFTEDEFELSDRLVSEEES
jgi:hypothetical protein